MHIRKKMLTFANEITYMCYEQEKNGYKVFTVWSDDFLRNKKKNSIELFKNFIDND